MTQVLFFHDASEKISATCELVQLTWQARQPLLLYVPEAQQAESVDRQLWTRPGTGFVPHCYVDSALAAQTPILIDSTLSQPTQKERLLSLSQETPPEFIRFARIAEVVAQEEQDRLAARQRARDYKMAGCELFFIRFQPADAPQHAARNLGAWL